MKKWVVWIFLVLMLCGCGPQEVFEPVEDVYAVMPQQPRKVIVELPAGASVTAMGSGQENALYFCDGYTLTVQTLPGGDLKKSLETLTGFPPEQLALFQTGDGAVRRYELAWTCAGEGGDQVGRLVLLDDGAYHYAVTVMAPAAETGKLRLAWDTVLSSVTLDRTGT